MISNMCHNNIFKQIKCINNERNALLGFKAMILGDPNDCVSTWSTKTEDVDGDDDCCNWRGVTCNNQTGHVMELDLGYCGLEGEISPSLFNLTSLTLLDLYFNSFHGTIPKSIGSLTQLKYLYLSGNSFHGAIPESIGFLTELTHLDLSYNSLNGSITESIGFLTELTSLSLSFNSFSGNIPPELGNLENLESLHLKDIGRCSVENISWLSRLSHLETLVMSGISLSKADHWVNAVLSLQNLTYLNLDNCNLSQVMHPYYPLSHVNYSSSNIVRLSLLHNNLNSSMYPWFYPLTSHNLILLDLSGNKLDEFPKYLGNLCSLTRLDISNNSAVVAFSDFLKPLSAGCTSATLAYLNTSSSQFTGSITNDIQPFYSLNTMDLSHNQLNGTISEMLWVLPMLHSLSLSSNSLEGVVFEKIAKSKIFYIDISSNNFRGKAPVLSTFTRSTGLDLSSNNFYGPITNVSSTLNLLNLSKNNFYGGISFLCQIVDGSLIYLDLSNNSFSGKVPDCLWHFKELKLLNLAQNNLSGKLPSSFEYLIQLEVLDLYNNTFTGELPLSLRNFNKLTFLDLGVNRFSGNVPFWIGESLLGLYVLSLGSNDFFGTIPLQLCQLVNLQILDLSMNNLDGTIPSCVNNLTSMVQEGFLLTQNVHEYFINTYSRGYDSWEYIDHAMIQWQGIIREFTNNIVLLKSIDLSSNKLTGEIPNELTDLRGLVALNFSNNALLGKIPSAISHMKKLLILDLSRNNCSGEMPTSMSQMTSLYDLDVSYNNLSGKIPLSTQLQSFEASRYIGNAGLCGLPLSERCRGDIQLEVPSPVGETEDSDQDEIERWFYIGGATGFGIGFWIVCITTLVISRGRQTFFHFIDTLEDRVYVKMLVFKTKFQRTSHP